MYNAPGDSEFDLSLVNENGVAPKSRIRTANQAYEICDQLRRDDTARSRKRSAVYKSYKRFPPSDYSKLVKSGYAWQSNCNWGQMEFVIDNQKSSFIDVITERNLVADVRTKYGKPHERAAWSDLISRGFDLVIRSWDDYLLNQEADLEDMLLYGKGVEMWDSMSGLYSEHVPINQILVPNRSKVNLSNSDVVIRIRHYNPVELYDKIRDKDVAREMGWNVNAVVDALRYHLNTGNTRNRDREDFLRDMAEGGVNLLNYVNKTIDVYEVYVKEYSGKISTMSILMDYAALHVGIKKSGVTADTIQKTIAKEGFLRVKEEYFDSFDDIIAPFTDSAGSGLWHEIKGLAERVFIQCRQYDVNMNRIMDAVYINMLLMIKGQNAEADQVLKEVGFKPHIILPHDCEPMQFRFQVPVGEAVQTMSFFMNDLYSGIAQYRPNQNANARTQRTKGEAEFDVAQSAKLNGTQIRRYNEWHSRYEKKMFKRLAGLKSGEDGYELKERFMEFLSENKVPDEAWDMDNIISVQSMMLSGAGDPAYKLMAAEKTIQLATMTSMSEGQEEAIKDAISALQGRQNVSRFRPEKTADIDGDDRIIGLENAGLSDFGSNPENFPVAPSDPHLKHIQGHFSQLMFRLEFAAKVLQADQVDEAQAIVMGIPTIGGHIMAHMKFLDRDVAMNGDKEKENTIKTIEKNMAAAGNMASQITQAIEEIQAVKRAESGGDMTPEQMKLQHEQALAQIKVWQAQMLAGIKIDNIANSHQLRQQGLQDKTAAQIAVQRAKAKDELQRKQMLAGATPPPVPPGVLAPSPNAQPGPEAEQGLTPNAPVPGSPPQP